MHNTIYCLHNTELYSTWTNKKAQFCAFFHTKILMEILFKDVKVNYEIVGDGEELFVFLHGWGANLDLMKSLAFAVGENHKCLLIDFPPFGKSQEPKQPWNLDDYVDLTAKIISQTLNLQQNKQNKHKTLISAIFAHSFGGRVALKGLSDGKFSSKRLILLSSAGIKPKMSIKTKLQIARFKFLKKIGSKKAEKFGSSDYKVLSPVMKQTFKEIINENLAPCCPKIGAKTLIIFGENDKETPPYMAKKLNKLIKNSQLYLIKGAGHFAYIENAAKVVPIIYAFLNFTS